MILNTWAIFLLLVFRWNDFSHKNNQPYAPYFLLKSLNINPTQFHHELTYYQNCRGEVGKEADQEENRSGICYKVQYWRMGDD